MVSSLSEDTLFQFDHHSDAIKTAALWSGLISYSFYTYDIRKAYKFHHNRLQMTASETNMTVSFETFSVPSGNRNETLICEKPEGSSLCAQRIVRRGLEYKSTVWTTDQTTLAR